MNFDMSLFDPAPSGLDYMNILGLRLHARIIS